MNLYIYVSGNSINRTDVGGLFDTSDGISYPEGAQHYFFGSGTLNVPFRSIDPGLGLGDFINACSYSPGTHQIDETKGDIDLFSASTFFTNAGPGRIVLQLVGTLTVKNGGSSGCCKEWSFAGYVGALSDPFDFDPQPWRNRGIIKELMTRGLYYLPFGNSFDVVFTGSRPITAQGCCK